MKNILSENMQRFGTKNLTESAKKKLIVKSIIETINQHGLQEAVKSALNEDVYEELKANPSPENVAKTIYNAKGTFNDSEAHVVAALQACKTYADWSAAAKVFQKLYKTTIIGYMGGFLSIEDLQLKKHAGSTADEELRRLYGDSYFDNVQPYFRNQGKLRSVADLKMSDFDTQSRRDNTKSGY